MCNCNKAGSAAKNKIFVPSPVSASVFSSSQSKRKKTRAAVQNTVKIAVQNEVILENIKGETLADKCKTFAYVLGLEHPVPENVLVAALENPDYANGLLIHRGDTYFYELINNPPEKISRISTTTLISKAGKALLQWGLSGFPTVSKKTLKKREDACLECPNLVESNSVLQKISASSKITSEIGNRTGNKSCSKCGCVIRNKIRLETETCPETLETTTGLNRWGENIL